MQPPPVTLSAYLGTGRDLSRWAPAAAPTTLEELGDRLEAAYTSLDADDEGAHVPCAWGPARPPAVAAPGRGGPGGCACLGAPHRGGPGGSWRRLMGPRTAHDDAPLRGLLCLLRRATPAA